jgi:hypothetical protein
MLLTTSSINPKTPGIISSLYRDRSHTYANCRTENTVVFKSHSTLSLGRRNNHDTRVHMGILNSAVLEPNCYFKYALYPFTFSSYTLPPAYAKFHLAGAVNSRKSADTSPCRTVLERCLVKSPSWKPAFHIAWLITMYKQSSVFAVLLCSNHEIFCAYANNILACVTG